MSSSRRDPWKFPERPNTCRSRKRRSDDAPRANEGPKRQRMNNGEDGQKTGHDLKPIGFKALESICREELTEKAVLELTRKAGQFEALLSMDDIRPDLLKLVITSFRMLCSSNNIMTANAEKILRSTKAKRFLTGTVLSSFINKMAYLGVNSGVDTVIMDLIAIFLTMIQKLGESIVHSLPIPQLSVSLAVLKEKNLIENTDDLEKKLQHVTELKDEVIRLAMSGHDQESQLKPPQNFRELRVIPSAADLLCSRPFLRKNITDRRFNDLDHYLDVQFRLLREDFVMPLRDGIKQLTKDKDLLEPTTSNTSPRANDVSVYHGVTVLYPVCNRKGRVFKIKFNQSHSKVRRIKWERSKRLNFGSLLCLSSDDFNTLVFASVENRDPEGLSDGELEVRFETTEAAEVNRFIQSKETFVMVESDAYYESYRHVLEGLKEINPEEFPFQRYIVECCQDIRPPAYQLHGKDDDKNNKSFTFKFDGVLAKKKSPETLVTNHRSSSPRLQVASEHALGTDSSQPGEGSGELSSDACTESLSNPDFVMDNEMPHEIFNWPDRESLGFNESQMRAFKLALTKEFALIQGPPGTGKTFVGLKIAQALLDNTSLWQDEKGSSPILMVSYTNHALDQFLEGLISNRGIVRVGGRSKSKTLEQFNLKSLKTMRASTVAHARRTTRNDVRVQKQSFQQSSLLMKALNSSIISLDFLRDQQCIQRRHYREFCTLAGKRSINDQLLEWLDISRNGRSNAKDDNRDDILMEVSVPGYDFDSDEEDIDGHKMTTLQKITVLSIKDSDNPNYMKRNLKNKAMNEHEELRVGSLIKLNRRDRWRLYRLWCQRLEKKQQENLQSCQVEFEEALSRDKELDTMIEYNVLRQARVIGMTTTCAARYRHILQRISPKIVLVEEAAEVLEAHLITSLSKGSQHLILIGDHQQLRPNPTVYELAKKYNLDVSLFERMVNVGISCEKLSVQHRMRPEIAALLKHIYPDLENHESVKEYEDIKGIKKNMFFVNHSNLENSHDESHSHTNEHEAAFVVALCRYLLQQGYTAGQITLLTTYTGQMFAIRDYLKQQNSEEFKSVRLTTVDNFQGEENDIILLSLVRSNKNEKVGFIKIVNRACVALSRAKKGFYCIGNFDLLSKHSEIWSKIVADLKASDSIGNALPLVCETHKDEVAAETAQDFSDKVPDGGCQRRCEVRLRCGHACKLLCHPGDPKHKKYVCGEPCGRNIQGCTHTCPNRCSEPCVKQCKVLVEKALPNCGHITQVKCFTQDLNRIPCKERCTNILSCNHRCQDYCQRPCTTECMELVKRTDWPCGHEVTVACSATPSDCPVPCRTNLDCGHPCPGKCGECRMGRIHQRCKLRCGRVLVCSHVCKETCSMPCPPCLKTCENRCVHSKCTKKCGEQCVPCRQPCSWVCRHHKCFKMCHEMCERPRCNRPCKKKLPCKHVCCGLACQRECICTVCDTNDGDPISTIFLGGEEDEDARFMKLPDCGHIFAVSDLDRYMDMSENDTTESQVIQLKTCPRCKTPIRCSLRYGNVIKQQLRDIEKVKRKIIVEANSGVSNKKRLLMGRLTTLSEKFNAENYQHVWKTLEQSVQKLKNGLKSPLLENKIMLMERYCLMTEKAEKYLKVLPGELCKENFLDGRQVTNDLNYLLKRFMAGTSTTRELQHINTEFSRLSLHLELCLLSHDVTVEKVEVDRQVDQSFYDMITTVRKELSSGKRIGDERLDEMMIDLAAIRRACSALKPLTEEEKKQIVEAVGLKKGHWFKCPQGHIYAIGECGGAMVRSKCPECGAVIGGANHTLEEGNELAPEMDGARHPAWSEQANLENYVILEEA